tara:strand:- start:637 stop:1239 length:603 start_codon:yes stop_codon:yes gene_type:complete
MIAKNCNEIFEKAIDDFHVTENVNTLMSNPYDEKSLENVMYEKCWIDTVQWHLEDLIRIPELDPKDAFSLKQRIDKSNQNRTDMVEKIDDYYFNLFESTSENALKMNTESPGWVVDRLSILCLKIFHMNEQVLREDVDKKHILECQEKLDILNLQQVDLSDAFDQLLEDYRFGIKKMKVYRQMKMYNDASLNPELYRKNK